EPAGRPEDPTQLLIDVTANRIDRSQQAPDDMSAGTTLAGRTPHLNSLARRIGEGHLRRTIRQVPDTQAGYVLLDEGLTHLRYPQDESGRPADPPSLSLQERKVYDQINATRMVTLLLTPPLQCSIDHVGAGQNVTPVDNKPKTDRLLPVLKYPDDGPLSAHRRRPRYWRLPSEHHPAASTSNVP